MKLKESWAAEQAEIDTACVPLVFLERCTIQGCSFVIFSSIDRTMSWICTPSTHTAVADVFVVQRVYLHCAALGDQSHNESLRYIIHASYDGYLVCFCDFTCVLRIYFFNWV